MARTAGLEDPYAPWFDSPQGRELAALAQSTDPAYYQYNIARYLCSTAWLRELAPGVSQLLILGSGADGRGIWLEALAENGVNVFEVDSASRLKGKQQVLKAHGVAIPERVRLVAGDLSADDIPSLLRAAGFTAPTPAMVLMEGVLYFLPAQASARILDPRWLGLSKGSRVILDYWSRERIDALNERVRDFIGRELFHAPPFEVDELVGKLRRNGFREAEVTPMEQLAERYFERAAEGDVLPGWLMVEATV